MLSQIFHECNLRKIGKFLLRSKWKLYEIKLWQHTGQWPSSYEKIVFCFSHWFENSMYLMYLYRCKMQCNLNALRTYFSKCQLIIFYFFVNLLFTKNHFKLKCIIILKYINSLLANCKLVFPQWFSSKALM